MALSVECPECFENYTVPDKLGGKEIRCKSCSAPILVEKPITLKRTPPPSSESPDSKPTGNKRRRKKKKKKRRSQSAGLSVFSFLGIFGFFFSHAGMLVTMIALTVGGIYNEPCSTLAFLYTFFVVIGGVRSRMRRGSDATTELGMGAVGLIAISVMIQTGQLDSDSSSDRSVSGNGQTESASTAGPSPRMPGAVLPAPKQPTVPPNLVPVPAGITSFSGIDQLQLNRDGRWQPVTVVSRLNNRFQVRYLGGRGRTMNVDRSELYIVRAVLASLESAPPAGGDAVQSADLVRVPANVKSLENAGPVYVKVNDHYHRVETEYKIGTKWHIRYLEGPFEGREVDRSELYVDRTRLAELQQANP